MPAEISPKRKALRALTYGLYIACVKYQGAYRAAIVTWLSQVSFNPAQIMVSLEKNGRLCDAVKNKGIFAINIPGNEQKKLAASLMKECRVEGKTINGFPFFESKSGAPCFENCTYYLECKVRQIIELDGHDIIIAEIIDATVGQETDPLTLKDTGWKYGG